MLKRGAQGTGITGLVNTLKSTFFPLFTTLDQPLRYSAIFHHHYAR
jgi:hypothetical protein